MRRRKYNGNKLTLQPRKFVAFNADDITSEIRLCLMLVETHKNSNTF